MIYLGSAPIAAPLLHPFIPLPNIFHTLSTWFVHTHCTLFTSLWNVAALVLQIRRYLWIGCTNAVFLLHFQCTLCCTIVASLLNLWYSICFSCSAPMLHLCSASAPLLNLLFPFPTLLAVNINSNDKQGSLSKFKNSWDRTLLSVHMFKCIPQLQQPGVDIKHHQHLSNVCK